MLLYCIFTVISVH